MVAFLFILGIACVIGLILTAVLVADDPFFNFTEKIVMWAIISFTFLLLITTMYYTIFKTDRPKDISSKAAVEEVKKEDTKKQQIERIRKKYMHEEIDSIFNNIKFPDDPER